MTINSVNANNVSFDKSQWSNTANVARQGSFVNMSVQVAESPESSLADSAEELTFVKDNSKKTKLADRKQKKSALFMEQQIEKLKKIVSACNSDFVNQKRLYNTWKSGSKNPKDLLSALKNSGGNAGSLYAFLEQIAEDETNASLKNLLKEISNNFFKENRSEILATANALDAIEDVSNETSLFIGQTYAELSCSETREPFDVLNFIVNKFDKNNIKEGIDYLFKALACDLNSNIRSQDIEILNDLASSLAKTKTLNASLVLVDDFTSRITNNLSLKNDLNSSEFLLSALNLSKERFVTNLAVANLYKHKVQTKDPTDEVLVAQSLLKLFRDMSDDVFASSDDRLKMIEATKKLVDMKVEKEDEWLDAGN